MIKQLYYPCCFFSQQVSHSQRLNDAPLHPWVAVSQDGTVKAAHCNCMAGLGEACSHIAATLFAVSAAVTIKQGQTCTSMPCKWIQPSEESLKASLYVKGSNIQFSQRQPSSEIDNLIDNQTAENKIDPSSLFNSLHEAEKKEAKPVQSAILAFVPGHCNRYIPRQVTLNIPPPLTDLYKAEYLKLKHTVIVIKSEEVLHSLTVTQEQVKKHCVIIIMVDLTIYKPLLLPHHNPSINIMI